MSSSWCTFNLSWSWLEAPSYFFLVQDVKQLIYCLHMAHIFSVQDEILWSMTVSMFCYVSIIDNVFVPGVLSKLRMFSRFFLLWPACFWFLHYDPKVCFTSCRPPHVQWPKRVADHSWELWKLLEFDILGDQNRPVHTSHQAGAFVQTEWQGPLMAPGNHKLGFWFGCILKEILHLLEALTFKYSNMFSHTSACIVTNVLCFIQNMLNHRPPLLVDWQIFVGFCWFGLVYHIISLLCLRKT